MTDHNHLRNRVRDWLDGATKLGCDVSTVHVQSLAVLMTHCDTRSVRAKLLDNGTWLRKGSASLFLSPKGMPYYLDHAGHEWLYHYMFNASENAMIQAGWLHISAGRVDVACRMTAAQQRWLDTHKPSVGFVPDSRENREWKPEAYCGADFADKAPVPYDKVAKFDVRPTADDNDWDRIEKRILNAASSPPAEPISVPLPPTRSVGPGEW